MFGFSVFRLARFRVCLARFAFEVQTTYATHELLWVKNATIEIPLPILKAFLVASQETIAIGLLVDISIAKDRTVSGESTPKKV